MERRLRLTFALAALATLALAGSAAPVGAADPAGNNGTIKVDKLPIDTLPDNESHPDCTFGVDFYGFDEGDLTATATFTVIAPTVAVDTVVVDQQPVGIGEDPASGAGTDTGLDATVVYDLNEALAPYIDSVDLRASTSGSRSTPKARPTQTPSTRPSGSQAAPASSADPSRPGVGADPRRRRHAADEVGA